MPDVDECIVNLIAKSLMTADVRGSAALSRLTERRTQLAFALREALAERLYGPDRACGPAEAGMDAPGFQAARRGPAPECRHAPLTFGGQGQGHETRRRVRDERENLVAS